MYNLKIAFWSPISGQSGTTSNIIIAAAMASLVDRKRTLLLHNQFSDNSMERAILGKGTGQELFEHIGLDSLSRNIKTAELSEELVHNSVISLYNNGIHLLPGTVKGHRQMFEAELLVSMPAILNSINQYYDLVFMDLVPGTNEVSVRMMEEADIIAVNLTQDINVINDYFDRYHLPEEKTVYLIGKYNKNSRYNLKNLMRTYHCLKHKTAVIPYNTEVMDAVIDGKLINLIIKDLVNGKGDDNRYFIKKAKQAVEEILGTWLKAGGII